MAENEFATLEEDSHPIPAISVPETDVFEDGVDILLHEYYQASDQNLGAVLTVSQPALMETVGRAKRSSPRPPLARQHSRSPSTRDPSLPSMRKALRLHGRTLARQPVSLSPRRPGARLDVARRAPLRQEADGDTPGPLRGFRAFRQPTPSHEGGTAGFANPRVLLSERRRTAEPGARGLTRARPPRSR